jgi:uncharacterized protein (DUF1778 family)
MEKSLLVESHRLKCTDICRTFESTNVNGMKDVQNARLELRLTKQRKAYFEEMAAMGGFKNLSDFIIHAADLQAKAIEADHHRILATARDRKIFFGALLNPPKPNAALKKAFKEYQEAIKEK